MRIHTITATLPLLVFLMLFQGFQHSSAQTVERRRSGDIAGLFSAGVLNGAGIGVTTFILDRVSAEASLGLLQIKLLEAGDEVKRTIGYSAAIGATWYTHRDDPVSPLVFIQTTYVAADGARIDQKRFSIAAGIGTEYSPLDGFAIFLRFGPAQQTIWTRGTGASELTMQFGAGLNLYF